MDIEAFKRDLKELVSNNPQDIIFILSYSDGRREEFTKKKDFGLRLLLVLEEERIEEIRIRTIKKKGFLGLNGVAMASAKITENLESVNFYILIEEDALKLKEKKRKEDEYFYKTIGK